MSPTAVVPGADGQTDEEGSVAEPRGSRRRLVMGSAALAAVLLVTSAVLGVLVLQKRGVDERREAIARAATQSALNLTSVDGEEFEQDVERVLEGSTGVFLTDFQARSEELKEVLVDNEVSAEGRVLEVAVLRDDEETATALVVVDGTVTNTAAPEGRVNSYRMRLELERVDGEWKTAMLEFVA